MSGFIYTAPARHLYQKIVLALCTPGQHTAKRQKSAQNNHVLACNFAKYSQILIFCTQTDSAMNLP